MHVLVYLPLVVPVVAAAFASALAERLPPRTATWLLTLSALTLAAASSAMLGLIAIAAAMRLPAFDSLGRLSVAAVRRTDPASVPAGVVACGLLLVAAAAAARAAWRRGTALVAAHREARRLAGPGQLVIVDDDGVDAYAAPGWPGRIVVTSGMLAALTETERAVLVAHERAHANGRHYLFTAAARLAAAANPLLRPLASAVGYAVERWADERAAAVVGSRPLAARTVAKAALAASARPSVRARPAVVPGAVPGAVPGGGPTRRSGSVPRRVDALLLPPPRRRLTLLTLAVAVVLISGLAAFDAAGDLHAMIEFAQAALGPSGLISR